MLLLLLDALENPVFTRVNRWSAILLKQRNCTPATGGQSTKEMEYTFSLT
jgi:hypothetical protein